LGANFDNIKKQSATVPARKSLQSSLLGLQLVSNTIRLVAALHHAHLSIDLLRITLAVSMAQPSAAISSLPPQASLGGSMGTSSSCLFRQQDVSAQGLDAIKKACGKA
jgi:hypothetical protein